MLVFTVNEIILFKKKESPMMSSPLNFTNCSDSTPFSLLVKQNPVVLEVKKEEGSFI